MMITGSSAPSAMDVRVCNEPGGRSSRLAKSAVLRKMRNGNEAKSKNFSLTFPPPSPRVSGLPSPSCPHDLAHATPWLYAERRHAGPTTCLRYLPTGTLNRASARLGGAWFLRMRHGNLAPRKVNDALGCSVLCAAADGPAKLPCLRRRLIVRMLTLPCFVPLSSISSAQEGCEDARRP